MPNRVLDYLLAAKDLPTGESRIFEIGSPDVVTCSVLIREYARQQGLRRWLIFVPVLTPYLSGLWLALVTPATYEVGPRWSGSMEMKLYFSRPEASPQTTRLSNRSTKSFGRSD